MPLDISIGIFAAMIVSRLFGMELSPLLVGLGIGFALLPDIDFLYALWRRGWRDTHAIIRHREYLHYPLVYVLISAAMAPSVGAAWAALFLLASMGHFIHDSIGLGWGVAWLWPFSNKSYTFLYRYTTPGKRLPRRFLYRWNREDMDHLIDEYRDADWLRNIYLRLHPVFTVEIAGFMLAVYLLWRIGSAYAGN